MITKFASDECGSNCTGISCLPRISDVLSSLIWILNLSSCDDVKLISVILMTLCQKVSKCEITLHNQIKNTEWVYKMHLCDKNYFI